MTPHETTIEVPQIVTLADVPVEFWIAMTIQFLITVFAIWASVKLIKFAFNIATRRKPPFTENLPAADPTPESIDDDFADIEAAMKAEK